MTRRSQAICRFVEEALKAKLCRRLDTGPAGMRYGFVQLTADC